MVAQLPTIAPSLRDQAALLRKTVVLTDELKEALRQIRVDKWTPLAGLELTVRSELVEHNMPGEDTLKHAAIYTLGACRVNKIGGSIGCTQVRIEELATGRSLVIKRPTGSPHWRLARDSARSSDRHVAHRYHGRGPRIDFGS